MAQSECSQTSAYKIQKPGNRPKERIQHSEDDESLKSEKCPFCSIFRIKPQIKKGETLYCINNNNTNNNNHIASLVQ